MKIELEFEFGTTDNERLYSKIVDMPFVPQMGNAISIGGLGGIESSVKEVTWDCDEKKLYVRLEPLILKRNSNEFLKRLQDTGFKA